MTIKSLYPSFYPTLDLNFANTRALDSRISFTRGSAATCVGSNGLLQSVASNTARFDHDPATGESLGLLIEEARTNLLLQSENLGTTWTLSAATISLNTAIAPDGQTTADTLIPNNGSIGVARQDILLADSTAYTFSVFLKTAGLNSLNLQFYNKANTFHGSKNLDLSTGVLSGSETIGVSSVIPYGNGWYRLILTNLGSGTGASTPNVRIVGFTTGNGTSGFYLWGAQLEAGAFPTSYIPTTASTVTRAADVAQITGTAFSSFYNQAEGSFFCSTFAPKGTVIFGTGDTFDNTQYVTVATSDNVFIRSGGSNQALLTAPVSSSANTNIAFSYASNSFAAVSNGGTILTDTAGNVAAAQIRLKLGSSAWDAGDSNSLNGTIRRLTYWSTQLPNETLQQVTK
jgi:hypothetical protein